MNPCEITVGDVVVKNSTPRAGGFSGKVYKANPKRIGVMSSYQYGAATPDNPPKPLDLGLVYRSEINYIVRGGNIIRIDP